MAITVVGRQWSVDWLASCRNHWRECSPPSKPWSFNRYRRHFLPAGPNWHKVFACFSGSSQQISVFRSFLRIFLVYIKLETLDLQSIQIEISKLTNICQVYGCSFPSWRIRLQHSRHTMEFPDEIPEIDWHWLVLLVSWRKQMPSQRRRIIWYLRPNLDTYPSSMEAWQPSKHHASQKYKMTIINLIF